MQKHDLEEVLSNPITIRSHFLINAPIMALGSNYLGNDSISIKSQYTLLHEYLHYEDYTYWPFLGMSYFWKTFIQLHKLFNFRYPLKQNHNYKNGLIFRWSSKSLDFKTKYLTITPKNFEIKNIGFDILLEASALLDHKFKPKTNILYDYSNVIINILLSDDLCNDNLIHMIGVRLMINAANDLNTRSLGKLFNTEFLEILPAVIPSLIAHRSFGYAMILNGFKSNILEWLEINDFIVRNYKEVWETYIEKTKSIYEDVLLKNKYDEFFKLFELRNLSIIGYHSFLQQTYLAMNKYFLKLFENNSSLLTIFFYPLLNILKYYEASNKATLLASNIPKLWEQWIPIPVILFWNKTLESVRIEINDKNKGYFIFKWSHSIKDMEDFYAAYGWIKMLFYNSFFNAIQSGDLSFYCPIWEWVVYQFKKLGQNNIKDIEIFCDKLCNKSMKLDINFNLKNYQLNPSEDYCCFNIKSKMMNKEQICLFHNTINSIINL